jgi:dTDP-glucose pyrophosphorylase
MLNIVVPMAGAGSRFSIAGYKDPKPLIPINGFPMIQVVIENLRPKIDHRFIFICQQEHINIYDLENKLNKWAPGSDIIGIKGITEGAACTVLKAQNLINNNDQLMIANSDQFIDVDINDYLNKLNINDLDGLIMTMNANDPKWSFIDIDNYGNVTRVVEKEVISDEATVGIYNFRFGKDFVKAANDMISKDLRVNNEFYVAPVYNQLIESSKKIGFFNIGSENNGMYGLGTPSDLELFLKTPILEKATKKFL